MTDGTKRVVAEIDAETHEILKRRLNHGELSEIIRDVSNTVAYGGGWDRTEVIDRRIAEKESELRDLREQRRDTDADIETLEDDLRDLRNEREEMQTEEEQFEGALWSFEQSFRRGELGHLTEDDPRLADLANEFAKSREELYNLIRDRNPDVPDHAFKPAMAAKWRFTGLDDDEIGTPVEKRGGETDD